jgi:hypothetical protein
MSTFKTILGMDFHFGIGFLSELIEGTGLKLDELSTQDDVILVPKLMYFSHKYALKRSGQDIDFTMANLHDFIDDNGGVGGKFWIDFKVAFNESMFKDVPTDENDKKKAKVAK